MSLIEDNSLFPLFNSADLQASALDFSAAGLVPDSPSKFAFLKKASGGFLANSQALTEEPLFSLFLSGGMCSAMLLRESITDHLRAHVMCTFSHVLNVFGVCELICWMRGLPYVIGITGLDESLLAGIVPDAAVPRVENNIPRQ